MVRRVGEVLQTIGGYGFHIYDDGGVGTSVTAFFPLLSTNLPAGSLRHG
jgi:hypothetical protein